MDMEGNIIAMACSCIAQGARSPAAACSSTWTGKGVAQTLLLCCLHVVECQGLAWVATACVHSCCNRLLHGLGN